MAGSGPGRGNHGEPKKKPVQPGSDGFPDNRFFCPLRDENDFCAELFIFLNQRDKAFAERPVQFFEGRRSGIPQWTPKQFHSIFPERNFNVHQLTDDFWLLSFVQHSRTRFGAESCSHPSLRSAQHPQQQQAAKQCQPK